MHEGLQFLTSTSVTTLLFASLLSLSTPSTPIFSDIQSHWAKECISQMAPRKLVSGYPDGSFRPNSTITRAEFAVLMLNAFPEAPVKRSGTTFNDVPANHWANKAIQDAYRHLVQRRGQAGEPLVRLNLLPGARREVQVDFIYPPDSTPPQVLTVRTEK